jgi:beta-phosphoglucomutase family hydrolase
VIFDWDGVIIDSSRHHEESWERLAEEKNLPLPTDHFRRGFGMKNQVIIPNILGWTRDAGEIEALGDRKEELYREIIREEGLQALPGVCALLEALRAAAVPRAVGSSTPRANIDCALDQLGLAAFFPVIVSAEHVTHGKPDPEVFLAAAAGLGLSPRRCLVIEDAHVGIEAADRAGMKVLGVASTHPAESLAEADRVVDTLAGLRVEDLESLLREPIR